MYIDPAVEEKSQAQLYVDPAVEEKSQARLSLDAAVDEKSQPRLHLDPAVDRDLIVAAPTTFGRVDSRADERDVEEREKERVQIRGIATWLILPVVICLSKRLSHACASASETAKGSLHQ